MSELSKVKVISLFSGAGGLDFGLKLAGLDIIWANDFDADSCQTYSQNIGPHIKCGDISIVDTALIPNGDLLVGGFPCQGFSVANRYRSPEDKRNELYLEYLRILMAKKPKWFVAENVSGILSLDKGKVFQMIIEDFQNAGYRVVHRLENMADFGVPQTRKRVIILGTREDLPISHNLAHPEPTHSKNPESGECSRERWKTMRDALLELEAAGPLNDVQSNYNLVLRNFVGHRATKYDAPSPTILARGNGKGGVNATPHPSGERRLSVMESAAMQSFPPEFEFTGSMTSKYRQIGNAVPPLYGKLIGQIIKKLGA